MAHDVIIDVGHVSKKFCRGLRRSLWYGLQDMASEVVGRNREGQPLRTDEFWAVDDVSFQLRRGECLGLIGHNGAGKTTLLKMLNGLIKPDHGCITMRGRVGALIALGAGFNPILTGRENVYVNASILGLAKHEVDRRFDEIVDFADLREFIDAPVQNYSTGMAVRLGFAIATTLEPDVLLLDEVLAVGDASFRHKCYSRISKLLSKAAVILVSHSMDYVGQVCDRVVLMQRGRASHFDETNQGIAAYLEQGPVGTDGKSEMVTAVYPPIERLTVHVPHEPIPYQGRLDVAVDIESSAEIDGVMFAFSATNSLAQTVFCWHSTRAGRRFALREGTNRLRFSISPLLLHQGTYRWTFNIGREGSIEHIAWFVNAGEFRVVSSFRPVGNIPYLGQAESCELELLTPLCEGDSRVILSKP